MNITNCYKSGMNENNCIKTAFGEALKFFRSKEKKLTQPKFAKIIGITQAAISKIENGGGVSDENKKAILEYFKVQESEFISKGEEIIESFKAEPITDSNIEGKEYTITILRNELQAAKEKDKVADKLITMQEAEIERLKNDVERLKAEIIKLKELS